MDALLEPEAQVALKAKSETFRSDVQVPLETLRSPLSTFEPLDFFGPSYEAVPVGSFQALENIRLRWVKPDWFEFLPDSQHPFQFTRHDGQVIQPRRMFTDGGSIPRFLWFKEALSPWGYAPAFLFHDWEFDLHHCKMNSRTFEEVRDTMMEGVKTLMELGICPKSLLVFKALFAGIDSDLARSIWSKTHDICPLPPDKSA